jgi:predicted TIM-barrel fold metal-dependent hydrolase
MASSIPTALPVDASRRRALGRMGSLSALGALGTTGLLAGCETTGAGSGAGTGKPHRIDVHHHLVPPSYAEDLVKRGGPRPIKWSAAASIEDMDRSGIALSLTSLVQPAVWFGDLALGRRLARESNEYAAKLAIDHPGRFGTFATLPLPDPEGSLKEIAYCLDVLKAEGFCLMTSYNGRYLGHPSFTPVLEELDRRSAVVYTHPLTADCCRNVVPGVPDSAIEYATDTTRTMASLLFSGAAARFPNIRWIWSHSGGTAPFLLSRFQYQEKTMKDAKRVLPNGVMHELARFHYDMAQGNHPGALDALARIAPVSQYLYGTDFPFRFGDEVNKALAEYPFTPAQRMAIERDNALRLIPSLKGKAS